VIALIDALKSKKHIVTIFKDIAKIVTEIPRVSAVKPPGSDPMSRALCSRHVHAPGAPFFQMD
jgi:hypothetical protein